MTKCFFIVALSLINFAFVKEITLNDGELTGEKLDPTTTYKFFIFVNNKANAELTLKFGGSLKRDYFQNCYVYEYVSKSGSYYKKIPFTFVVSRPDYYNEHTVIHTKSNGSIKYIAFEFKPYYELNPLIIGKVIDNPKDFYTLSSGKKFTLDLYSSLDYNFFLSAKKSEKVKFTISFPIINWDKEVFKDQRIYIYECFSENKNDCDKISQWEYNFSKSGKNAKLSASFKLTHKNVKYARFRVTPFFSFRTSDIKATIENKYKILIIIIIGVVALLVLAIIIYLIYRHRHKKKSLDENIVTNEMNKPLYNEME